MKRIFDFVCSYGHATERLVSDEVRTIQCPHCVGIRSVAERVVSAPQIKLDGCSGDFPGEYSRWERIRAEKLAVERKRKASHGDE